MKKADSDIQYETIVVTPEIAQGWIEGKAMTRNISDAVVARYAAIMRQGLWKYSPHAIAFDPEGRLIDGQHRLWAVVESGCSVKSLIAKNCPIDSILVMDQGRPRTAADNINLSGGISGHLVSNDDVAVFRLMVIGSELRFPLPSEVVHECMPFYMESIEFSKECFGRRTAAPAIKTIRAIISRASFTKNRDRLMRFGRCLLEGVTDRASERAAIKLRDLVMGEWRSCLQKPTSRAVWGKTESMLKHFLSGTCPEKVVAHSTEQFDIPEPLQLRRWKELQAAAELKRQQRRRSQPSPAAEPKPATAAKAAGRG